MKNGVILTWPNWSKWLFVNLTFWKLIVCLIHCAPLDGPSGWTYKRPGRWGSALPATVHSELWNLYRLSSTGTISITRMYFSFGFSPEMLILMTGNIRLKKRKIFYIIGTRIFKLSPEEMVPDIFNILNDKTLKAASLTNFFKSKYTC